MRYPPKSDLEKPPPQGEGFVSQKGSLLTFPPKPKKRRGWEKPQPPPPPKAPPPTGRARRRARAVAPRPAAAGHAEAFASEARLRRFLASAQLDLEVLAPSDARSPDDRRVLGDRGRGANEGGTRELSEGDGEGEKGGTQKGLEVEKEGKPKGAVEFLGELFGECHSSRPMGT